MDRRTFEGPMDWEYQGTGPLDAASPFTHVAQKTSHSIFASTPSRVNQPSKLVGGFNTGVPSSPNKPLPAVPQAPFFSPRIAGSQTAPPFRNPAFTTPRKPFDDLVMSEASGAETSPALTEGSDYPNDTPEADRTADMQMATITPSRIDKSFRYVKQGASRRHAAGKGEIPRGHRDHPSIDLFRKRKRHNRDRDVSTGRLVHRSRTWDDTEDDSDASTQQSSSRGGRSRDGARANGSWLGSIFRAMDDHPNAPENFQKWVQSILNTIMALSCAYLAWSVVDAVRLDIRTANESARTLRLNEITACQEKYKANQCQDNKLPALIDVCKEWYDCMIDDPDSIKRVRTTIREIAAVINEFAGEMHLKAWAFFFAIILILVISNKATMGRSTTNARMQPTPSQPATAGIHHAHADPSQGLMWVPLQTPRSYRKESHFQIEDEGEGTDSDAGERPAYMIMAPQTPISRRSPNKGGLSLSYSPTKGSRSPHKRI